MLVSRRLSRQHVARLIQRQLHSDTAAELRRHLHSESTSVQPLDAIEQLPDIRRLLADTRLEFPQDRDVEPSSSHVPFSARPQVKGIVTSIDKAIRRSENDATELLKTLQDAIFRPDLPSKASSSKSHGKPKRPKKPKGLRGETPQVTQNTSPQRLHKHKTAAKTEDKYMQRMIKESTKKTKADSKFDEMRAAPPHPPSSRHPAEDTNPFWRLPRLPLPYTRQVECLLEPSSSTLEDLVPPSQQRPIAELGHGLERILFNPGVHWLQDPRTGVYNFTPYLQTIPKLEDFDFDRVTGFIRSSQDDDLFTLAKRENCVFTGSTSSLTGLLSQSYFLISMDKDVDLSTLSRYFQRESALFTAAQRMPVSVTLEHRDGVYSINSASNSIIAEKNILSWMGTMLEKFLTTTPEEFAALLHATPMPEVEKDPRREAYRFAKIGNFVMRSQLDCYDPRLPGTGIFDIKTRAALPLRLDNMNFEENSGYLIRTLTGPYESFEREYYDLVRSAFLKYSFQARIGNMDGVIIAYHNTERIFGFQYVSLEEMDTRLYGVPQVGERVFEKCVTLLETVLGEVVSCFPGQSIACTFDTQPGGRMLSVWAEPTEWDEALGPAPIVQFDVSVVNYIGDRPVSGHLAVVEVNEPWSLLYTIRRSALSPAEIHEKRLEAFKKQFRAIALPTGMTPKMAAEMWASINFGGKAVDEAVQAELLKELKFEPPSQSIKELRAMARSGRAHTLKIEQALVAKEAMALSIETRNRRDRLPYPFWLDSSINSVIYTA